MPHLCPLTEIQTTRCGANSCMWHSDRTSTGCFHDLVRHDSITKDEISRFKDCSGVGRSKERIQAVLVLDRYVSEARVRGKTPIPEDLRVLCADTPLLREDLFPGMSLETLKHLCNPSTFAKFASQLHCKTTVLDVLFLHQSQVDSILNYQE